MGAQLLNFDTYIDTEECCSCGVQFGMPKSLLRKRREDGNWFYCPNGHPQHYSETEVQRLQKQLDAEKRNTEWYKGRVEAYRKEADDTKKKLTAQKAQTTKLKNRIANGVCPCCHRSFQNLRRHMDTKHPDYTEAQPAAKEE